MGQKLVTRKEFADMAQVTAAAVTKACKAELKPAIFGRRLDANHPAAIEYLQNHDETTTRKTADGLDALYGEAAAWCFENSRYSATGIQKQFKIGYGRAKKILTQMQEQGAVPGEGKKPPQGSGGAKASEKKKADVKQAAKEASERKGTTSPDNGPQVPPDPVPEDMRAYADYTLRQIIEKFGTITNFNDVLRATKTIEEINEKATKNRLRRGELIERDYVAGSIFSLLDVAFKRLVTDVPKTTGAEVLAIVEEGGDSLGVRLEAVIRDANSKAIKATKEQILRRLENA
jgi:hypothetical protein